MNRRRFLLIHYQAIIGLAGWGLLATALPGSDTTVGGLFFLVLAVVTELLGITLAGQRITSTFTPAYAAFLLWGISPAAWILALPGLVVLLNRSPSVSQFLFLTGERVLSLFVAGEFYFRLGGTIDLRTASTEDILMAPGFVLVYILFHQSLYAGYYGLLDGRHWRKNWLKFARWDWLSCVVMVPFGMFMALAFRSGGYTLATLAFVPMFVVAYVFRLQIRLHMTNLQLTVLHQLSQRMSAALDLNRVIDSFLEAIEELIGPCQRALYLMDEGRDDIILAKAAGEGEPWPWRKVKVGEGPIGAAALSRKGLRETAYQPSEGGPAGAYRSALAIPLLRDDRLLGVVAAVHPGRRSFGSGEFRLITLLANLGTLLIDNAAAYQQAEGMANLDQMTGLYNYRFFYHRLQEEIRTAARDGQKLSLLYLDIDDFKRFNTKHGHLFGDCVLRECARLLKQSVRETDITVRYGGDEFVALLPGVDREEARQVADRVSSAVAGYVFRGIDPGQEERVSVSTGVATFPDDASTPDELISAADKAMYEIKRGGSAWIV